MIQFQELHHDLTEATDINKYLDSKDNFFKRNYIAINPDFYPELLHTLSEFRLTYNNENLVDGSLFWSNNYDCYDLGWLSGLFKFIMINTRSLSVKYQNKVPGIYYCALVPIILAAHKKFNNIPYSKWDKSTISHVVNKDLLDAMLWKQPEPISKEDLILARRAGLIIGSGPKMGQSRNAASTYSLSGYYDPRVKAMPKLAQVMATQIWVADPSIRNEYMVLDPTDWDNMPTPLIENQPLFTSTSNKLPWD